MNDKLAGLLNQYDKQQAEEAVVKERRKTAEEQFVEDFKAWRTDVARPALEKVKTQFEAAGHRVAIRLEEGPPARVDSNQAPPLAISLEVQLKRVAQTAFTDRKPTIQYAAQSGTQTVMGWRSTVSRGGGVSGPFGTFVLTDLTGAAIETHVVEWFAQCVGIR